MTSYDIQRKEEKTKNRMSGTRGHTTLDNKGENDTTKRGRSMFDQHTFASSGEAARYSRSLDTNNASLSTSCSEQGLSNWFRSTRALALYWIVLDDTSGGETLLSRR